MRQICFFISLLAISNYAPAEVNLLKEEMVLRSSILHYPMIQKALNDVESAKMKVKAAYGAFDLNLKVKGDVRPKGYYDGKSVDFLLEKPLPFMNSKIYSGYKISEGENPSYEQKRDTLNGGEYRIGLALSLWRDRDIDEKRLKLRMKELDLSNKEIDVLRSQLNINRKASKAYWKWVAKGNIYKVHESLLKIALDREKALAKRIKKGDLAKIYQTENRQYIVKRQSKVVDSKREYLEAKIDLSLFLRDESGNPLIPANTMLPTELNGEVKITEEEMQKATQLAKEKSPEILSLGYKIEALGQEEAFGENSLAPRVDLKFEVSDDQGSGSKTLQGAENRVFLKLEIPLERNLGKGELEAARAKKRGVIFKRQLAKEKIETNLKKHLYRLNASVEKIDYTNKEVEYATRLQEVELTRFNRGASDFFVVNLREQNTADSKINNIKARLEYHLALADYRAASMQVMGK